MTSQAIVRVVIISGWIITLCTALIIIGAVVALSLMGKPVVDPLPQWGGISLGFLFGNLFTQVMKLLEPQNS